MKRQKVEDQGQSFQNVKEILVMNQSAFYDAQLGNTKETDREDSDTIFVKRFNNFIKSQLINHFCFFSGMGGRHLSILDLCCGRGGDLGKWAKNEIAHYVGVDLSRPLVVEAQRRYIESHVNAKPRYGN